MKYNNGIHHITALAGDAQVNAEFYVQQLGMRLVKKSVNQDDPGTYHLFYGNREGDPGSGLTFFPWPRAAQGKAGVGEAVSVALAVPSVSMDFWAERLAEQGIEFDGPVDRFGYQVWQFQDPDSMKLEFVFDTRVDELSGWDQGSVPAEYGIRGFWGATLLLEEIESTSRILTEVFGFEKNGEEEGQVLYSTDAHIGHSVILQKGSVRPSRSGRGTIHHVAFRAKDDEDLMEFRSKVIQMGLHPTDYIDRHWFHSVYFRTPGGVLFEIATDGPGYDVDEDSARLGEKLILPPWLESRREWIESRLPAIEVR